LVPVWDLIELHERSSELSVDRDSVVESLRRLSDRKYQQEWLGTNLAVDSSFVESVNILFDDSGLQESLENGTVFGEAIDEHLRQLGDELDLIDEDQPVESLLRDPQLSRVSELATAIVEELLAEPPRP
jgi:hypothetical protein